MKFIKVKATMTNGNIPVEMYISTRMILAITDDSQIILKDDQLNVTAGILRIGIHTYSNIVAANYKDIENLLL